MAEDLAKALAASRKGYVVAAAGCGKTHLIAQATACCDRRQLILTHTHAGVRAILNHLRRQQVSPSLFKVATIHGFALKYASAFPILAEWKIQRPLAEEWHEVPPAAQRTLTRSCIRRVTQAFLLMSIRTALSNSTRSSALWLKSFHVGLSGIRYRASSGN